MLFIFGSYIAFALLSFREEMEPGHICHQIRYVNLFSYAVSFLSLVKFLLRNNRVD